MRLIHRHSLREAPDAASGTTGVGLRTGDVGRASHVSTAWPLGESPPFCVHTRRPCSLALFVSLSTAIRMTHRRSTPTVTRARKKRPSSMRKKPMLEKTMARLL